MTLFSQDRLLADPIAVLILSWEDAKWPFAHFKVFLPGKKLMKCLFSNKCLQKNYKKESFIIFPFYTLWSATSDLRRLFPLMRHGPGDYHWCRRRGRRGCKRPPIVLICRKSWQTLGKNPENLGKIPENPDEKGVKRLHKNIKRPFFGGHTKNDLCGRKVLGKSRTKNFLASLGKFEQKSFFAPPKIRLLLHLRWLHS